MSQYIVEYTDTVRPEWIDSNGHMNLAYYVVVFDLATDKRQRTTDKLNGFVSQILIGVATGYSIIA